PQLSWSTTIILCFGAFSGGLGPSFYKTFEIEKDNFQVHGRARQAIISSLTVPLWAAELRAPERLGCLGSRKIVPSGSPRYRRAYHLNQMRICRQKFHCSAMLQRRGLR